MMNILAIIPARAGSKGVPGKNKKILQGKPLIVYTLEFALKCKLITKIVVSSDDLEILEMKSLFTNIEFIQRPIHLAEDCTPTLPVMQHVVEELKTKGEDYELICLLQPTNPFRQPGFLDICINHFKESHCDSLVSVLKVPHVYNPHWVYEVEESGFLKISTGEKEIIPRRQQLPNAYFRDGSVYITMTENIIEKSRILGDKIAYIESDPDSYVNIDSQVDWIIAEEKAKKLL